MTIVHTQHHRHHPSTSHNPRVPPKILKLAYSLILLFITFSLNYRLLNYRHQLNYKLRKSVLNVVISRTIHISRKIPTNNLISGMSAQRLFSHWYSHNYQAPLDCRAFSCSLLSGQVQLLNYS